MDKAKAPFVVGDQVTTDFCYDEANVVRTVTGITRDSNCGSGWRMSTDCGGECKTCGRPLGTTIPWVDSAHFKPWPHRETT